MPLFGIRYGTLARRTWPLLASAFGAVLTLFLLPQTGTRSSPPRWPSSCGCWRSRCPGSSSSPPPTRPTWPTRSCRTPGSRRGSPSARSPRGGCVPLLGQEWQQIGYARRARGIDAGRNPLARLRLLASAAFTLLVGAIRRGTRLAAAMDARGFDSGLPRTCARSQPFRRSDAVLIAAATVVAAGAVTASVLTGAFHPLFF